MVDEIDEIADKAHKNEQDAQGNGSTGFLDFLEEQCKVGQGGRLYIVTHFCVSGEVRRRVYAGDEFLSWADGLPPGMREEVRRLERGHAETVVALDAREPLPLGEKIVVEVIRPVRTVLIFGAGHVGAAVSRFAALLGYEVILVDDRREFLYSDKLSGWRITRLFSSFDEVGKRVTVPENTAVIIVTRGHHYDEVCLRQFIDSPAVYLGMIGSRRRVLGILQRLRDSGVAESLLERVKAPIGLRIGAKTPEEIAIAILAQAIQSFNQIREGEAHDSK